jgi:hypothetical protein
LTDLPAHAGYANAKIAVSNRQDHGVAMPKKTGPPRIERLPAAKQRRLDALLDKNSEGTITSRERLRLEQLVAEAERLMVANAKRLEKFSRSDYSPAGGVPVTVWIQPKHAGR